ncbi:hypothetical protein ScPMuIL_013362 [Solemya velum]
MYIGFVSFILTTASPLIVSTVTQYPRWSQWINWNQNANGDEVERLTDAQLRQLCPQGHITNIECQTTLGYPANSTSDNKTCDIQNGLVCRGPCVYNYKVRYLCSNSPHSCSHYCWGGLCTPGGCICQPPRQGVNCERYTCNVNCGRHGYCSGPNYCSCHSGWMGSTCNQPYCGGCQNGGRCVGPYKCSCQEGFRGAHCEQPDLSFYSPVCLFGHGIDDLFCPCLYGKSGSDCSQNVTMCLSSMTDFRNAVVRCGYNLNEQREHCFVRCNFGYRLNPIHDPIKFFSCVSDGQVYPAVNRDTFCLVDDALASFNITQPALG